MKTINNFFRLAKVAIILMVAALCVSFVPLSNAYASSNSETQYSKAHWKTFDISHLKLDTSAIEYRGSETYRDTVRSGCANQFEDGKKYNFTDCSSDYIIKNLSLWAFNEEYDSNSNNEFICFRYHTDTPWWDANGEDFKVSGSIIVNGTTYKTFNYSWTDLSDQDEEQDMVSVWEMDHDQFVADCGCSLAEGIMSGAIEIRMDKLECDPC